MRENKPLTFRCTGRRPDALGSTGLEVGSPLRCERPLSPAAPVSSQHVRWRHVRPLPALIVVLTASPATAEVMDKEPSVGAIWKSVLVAVAIACVAAVLQRWLLLVSFLVFLPSAAILAWTESHNRHVGPAILSEAGPGYPLTANATVALVLAAHVGLWFFASWWRHRRRPTQDPPPSSTHLRSVAYTVALVLLLTLASAGEFTAEPSIFWSAPFLVGVACVLAAAMLWWAERKAQPPSAAV